MKQPVVASALLIMIAFGLAHASPEPVVRPFGSQRNHHANGKRPCDGSKQRFEVR